MVYGWNVSDDDDGNEYQYTATRRSQYSENKREKMHRDPTDRLPTGKSGAPFFVAVISRAGRRSYVAKGCAVARGSRSVATIPSFFLLLLPSPAAAAYCAIGV